MTTASMTAENPAQQDERWTEGMAHLQAGKWKAAAECFERLAQAYPEDQATQRALEEAQFKAALDRKGRVRGRRWIIPWRAIVVRSLLVVAVAIVGFLAWFLIDNYVKVFYEDWREQRQLARLRSDGRSLLDAGMLDQSEEKWNALLARVPGDPEALAGLEEIEAQRELLSLYEAAVAAQEAGELDSALAQFQDLQLLEFGYKDVSDRIEEIRRLQDRNELLASAREAFDAGRDAEALSRYEELCERYADSCSEPEVQGRLYSLHVAVGQQLLDQTPPAAERVPEALDHFEKALAIRPGDSVADYERGLAQSFLYGQEAYQAEDWGAAVRQLRALYNERPGYLGGLVVQMLYEAYIFYGDLYKDPGPSQDCAFADQQYNLASQLPVGDTTMASSRRDHVAYCIPPTLTPTNTPTPTLTPTITPTPSPTLPPTITPIPSATYTPTPRTLSAFHNKILFKQVDDTVIKYQDVGDSVATLWVMNPDGSNRRQLGLFSQYKDQFEALYEQYTRSPDGGRYQAITNDLGQIAILLPPDDEYAPGSANQITFLSEICYDPQWSPDGGRILFVSQEGYSDDIWVTSVDGRNATQLTNNFWEWEKHPAWSPDSDQIVFWSNRNGLAQIYVMDAEGRYPTNISQQSTFNEWDPIWVR